MLTLIANHLWQSTLFAAACGLLTLALRNNRAAVRHRLWVAASMKFLVPFAALTAIGRELGWRVFPAASGRPLTIAMEFVSQRFMGTVPQASVQPALSVQTASSPNLAAILIALALGLWIAGGAAWLAIWLVRWCRVLGAVRAAVPIDAGRELAVLRRVERDWDLSAPIALVESEASMEPGVFGILKPVLLWPRRISAHLSDRHIEAIIAHEISHVRRRDNLVAAVHMVVQAVFWFHPLVWWVGARLVAERERACDEAVVRFGSEPEVYAESILKTCELSIEAPLACVAGVTGADLKRRIELIMTNQAAHTLSGAKRIVLGVAASSALVVPLAIGVINRPTLLAQTSAAQEVANPSFEVASVKPNRSGDGPMRISLQPGGRVTALNMPLRDVIRFAYHFQNFQILGGPDWLGDHFDIAAKAEHDIPPSPPDAIGAGQLMMQSLLSERFRLTVHREQRELPIYALVLARSDGRLGPFLKLPNVDCEALLNAARARGAAPSPPPAGGPVCGLRMSPGRMIGGGFPLSQLAAALSQLTQRVVVDRTGLAGNFDFELSFTPDQTMLGQLPPGVPRPPIDPDGPSIFTALQEQLGLKLESQRAPTEVLVIDHVEQPTPD